MTFAAVQERTGYWLANPSQFVMARYEIETLPLNYRELEELHDTIEVIRWRVWFPKLQEELEGTELPAKIGLAATAGGWGSLGVGAVSGGSSLLVKSELTKRILVVAAKCFGLTGVAGLVVASYIINVVLEKSEQNLVTYKKDAKMVSLQMQHVVQKRQGEFHGCAIRATLQLAGAQERQIAHLQDQQQQQQQLLMDRDQSIADLRADQDQKIEDLSNQFQAFVAGIRN